MRRQKEKGKNRYICCIWCGREMKNPYARIDVGEKHEDKR